MFVNPDATFELQADRVYKFYDRVGEIRDNYSKGDTDARQVNLNNIMMAANGSVATLRLMHWTKEQGEGAMLQALKLSKPEYIQYVAEDLLRSSRLFLLLETQFQIESLFRNILKQLGLPNAKQGFYNVAKSILDFSKISDLDKKLRILNVPALMRNSMHSNGIHHGFQGSDTTEEINGVEFRFENEKKIKCGSWFHIVTAVTASIAIVEEILASSPVSSISLIHDSYAIQKAVEGEESKMPIT